MARKLLRGDELAEFIKQRQAKQVRNLRQTYSIVPKLAIVMSRHAGSVIQTYVRMKQRYADDIVVETEVIACDDDELLMTLARLNADETIQGIIVQLPIDNASQTQTVVDAIAPAKDVDGLGVNAQYHSATAEAIDWLLAGYNVTLADKTITLLGAGRLVGGPLQAMWQARGYNVTTLTRDDDQAKIDATLQRSQIIVSATGSPDILTNHNVPHGAVVVDAGTVSEDGKIRGDTAQELQIRRDLTITPQKGGVGPLTIVLLFEHVIQACYKQAGVLPNE